MSWSSQLSTCSFSGVTFEVQALDDQLERRIAEHEYPWRDGADLDDLGRKARRTRVTAVFMGDEYEGDLGAFLQLVDKGQSGTFIHPVLGTWTARIVRAGTAHTHEARDMATVEVEVVEDGTSSELDTLSSVSALEDEVETSAGDLEDAVDELEGVDPSTLEDVVDAVSDAVAEAMDFASQVTSAINRATSLVNQVRKKIDKAISTARKLTDIKSWPVVKAAEQLVRSCQKLAERATGQRSVLRTRTLTAATPLALLAHSLYGDASRMSELLALNPTIRNPFFMSSGVELTVHGR